MPSRCAIIFICFLLLKTWPAMAAEHAKVTLFLFPDAGVSPQVITTIFTNLTKSLAANPHIELKDSDKLLAEYAGEIPNETINQAKSDFAHGLTKLQQNQPTEAISHFLQAISGFEQTLAFIKKEKLAQCSLALAIAEAEARQPRKALATMVQLLTWRPHFRYDATSFDTKYIPMFEKARALVKNLKRGSVELTSDPVSAKVYVDGSFMGVTPTVVFGLRVGTHYVTYKHPGFIKAAQRIMVSPNLQTSYSHSLKRSEKYLLLQQALDSSRKSLGQIKTNSDMLNLRTFLYIDQVIFAKIKTDSANKVLIEAYLYDLRSKLRLNKASQSVTVNNIEELKQLAQTIYLNVRYDGSIEAPPELPPPPPPKRAHFYTTWWFWTAVAVGAAGITIPILYWPKSNACPQGNYCLNIRN